MLQPTPREYKDYRGLIVYQKAFENSAKLLTYYRTQKPLWCEQFIIQQLLRAITSIVANIVEGYGRNGSVEYRRFLTIAKGSAMKVEFWIATLLVVRPQDSKTLEEISPLNTEVIKMLSTMIYKRKANLTTN